MPLHDTTKRIGRRRPLTTDLETGHFLTDGKRLYRIVDRVPASALLENCRVPGEQPFWEPLTRLLAGPFQVVTPSK